MPARIVEPDPQRVLPPQVDPEILARATHTAHVDKRVLRIFVSHNTEYEAIATQLRLALQALESKYELAVLLCEDMPGSTEWEKWIRESVRDAHLFLLLYPHEDADMTWCTYEKALFDASAQAGTAVTCIKNPGLEPPKLFEKYQSYDATPSGLRNFLHDLFVKGTFTDDVPVNPEVGMDGTRFHTRAKEVVQELEAKFAGARVQAAFFEKRIKVILPDAPRPAQDLDRAMVEGNSVALDLLGLRSQGLVAWRVLRDAARDQGATWPDDVQAALPRMNDGLVPSQLSPFMGRDDIYIPVISRIETVDQHLRSFYIIFVQANEEKLRPMIDWAPPAATPDGWSYLVRLLVALIHVRWDLLEPALQDASRRRASAQSIQACGASVLHTLEQLSEQWKAKGGGGRAKFTYAFDDSLSDRIDTLAVDWQAAHGQLEQAVASKSEEIPDALAAMVRNNAHWLDLAARQLASLTKRLERETRAASTRPPAQ
jgi:hypothetical protein